MRHNDLKFDGEHHITGRGMVLSLTLSKNNILAKGRDCGIYLEDEVVYNDKLYSIRGIESFQQAHSIGDSIGLLVKEVPMA
jgi:hypothetical protein